MFNQVGIHRSQASRYDGRIKGIHIRQLRRYNNVHSMAETDVLIPAATDINNVHCDDGLGSFPFFC